MKAVVKVMLKKGVLDPQGKAIGTALQGLGFSGLGDVRQGKIIEIDLGPGMGENDVKTMCEKLLTNPVIEDYKIEIAG